MAGLLANKFLAIIIIESSGFVRDLKLNLTIFKQTYFTATSLNFEYKKVRSFLILFMDYPNRTEYCKMNTYYPPIDPSSLECRFESIPRTKSVNSLFKLDLDFCVTN